MRAMGEKLTVKTPARRQKRPMVFGGEELSAPGAEGRTICAAVKYSGAVVGGDPPDVLALETGLVAAMPGGVEPATLPFRVEGTRWAVTRAYTVRGAVPARFSGPSFLTLPEVAGSRAVAGRWPPDLGRSLATARVRDRGDRCQGSRW